MINCFWDSSALAKLYHIEDGSDQAALIFADPEYLHFASDLSKVEIRHVLGRHFREGKLEKRLMDVVIRRFSLDSLERIQFIGLNDDIINEAGSIALNYAVKSLDALILATLEEFRHSSQRTIFISSDSKQIKLAEELGYEVTSPSDRKK